MPLPPVKVLVVDDSPVVRQAMSEVLSSDPQIEVIGTAADPYGAVAIMRERTPDVLTLDIEMPRMDGLTFLQKIMAQHPIPVLICSSHATEGAEATLKALEYGAADIVAKPRLGTAQFLAESRILLCDAVKAAARIPANRLRAPSAPRPKLTADAILDKGRGGEADPASPSRIVVLGASTGGTEAISILLEALPATAPGMVIVQHMPENFTSSFAMNLDSFCRVCVKEAADGEPILPGQVLIAPGGKHTLIQRQGKGYRVEVRDGPLVCRHRPSVDVLFRSAAKFVGANAIGILLTGMGDDGALGLKELRDAGAFTIAQDETSSVVFGMPKEAIRLGGAERVLPLAQIASTLMRASRPNTTP